jgi:sterol desaturase/sphingolipid hydroxylase (fatty acid hydroxylase superfamily)
VQEIGFIVAAVFVTSVAAELIWSRVAGHGVYSLKEALSNLGMMIVGNGLRPAATAWTLLVLSLLEPLRSVRMPETGWTFLVTFLVVDFAYYWYHRLSHEVPLLWAIHHAHHSSPWMNLTTAVRLNWIGKFLSPLFFAPLVLLGLPATFVTASLAIGLLYQFPLHTRAIGRLGRFEGTVLNTPSAHRVHHGSNARYIDRNYAGVFIVWDRLFGTYRRHGRLCWAQPDRCTVPAALEVCLRAVAAREAGRVRSGSHAAHRHLRGPDSGVNRMREVLVGQSV